MANLLSPREAALRLGISYPTMKQWLYRGKLKAIKTPGGHYRIPEAELDGLLHKTRRPETPKRQMMRTVSGLHQLVGRIVELKLEGLLAQVKLSIGGQIITSLITADAARELHIPLVSTAVGQFDGQLGVFRGWEADKPCYRCLVGHDPDRPDISCADQGVLGALTGVLGSLAAIEAIRAVVPFGTDPAGQMLLIDALGFRFRTIGLPKDPGCGCGR